MSNSVSESAFTEDVAGGSIQLFPDPYSEEPVRSEIYGPEHL